MTKPIDQATKDLIEKEAIAEFPDKPDTGLVYNNSARRSGYIAGATVWAEKLKQERNKVIDECITKIKKEWPNIQKMKYQETVLVDIELELLSLKDKSHE